MPYITQRQREYLKYGCKFDDEAVKEFTAGDINYMISQCLNDYLEVNGITYTNINTLIGVLECAKLELYRCVAAPYEEKKKEDHGDVYSV